ncbi:hypothetical protein EXIGLDRAFT_52742 [Exidia glandulosa HHB12029]|uniref:Uncharacterized protein n=1 Tax=Exidia glandulosa HHB12029 TaxID=1314781 RepID=A0A165ID00_EXIGL|nr:hypothetical protein EXIGLDRAFT_52742 [Exidia glandulosa HHB12029]
MTSDACAMSSGRKDHPQDGFDVPAQMSTPASSHGTPPLAPHRRRRDAVCHVDGRLARRTEIAMNERVIEPGDRNGSRTLDVVTRQRAAGRSPQQTSKRYLGLAHTRPRSAPGVFCSCIDGFPSGV